jgi:hypothetical protein
MANHEAPEGYVSRSSDLAGFWDSEEGPPIHFIPQSYRLSDSKIEPKKMSVLIIGTLVSDCPVIDSEDKEVLAVKGQEVGVWYKPGMAGIKKLAGVPVFMYRDKTKDKKIPGKPSDMKGYEVKSKNLGAPLSCSGDHRKQSKPEAAPPAQAPTQDAGFTDDIPF